MKPRILLHVPAMSDGSLRYETAMALINATAGMAEIAMHFTQSSAATLTWNSVWCQALNQRKHGATHYAMIHADLYPENFWIDRLLEIMEREGAEIVSAVVANKDDTGLVSTAIDGRDPFNAHRFTLSQLAAYKPTITSPHLLVNNGLMLVDLSSHWVEQVWYENSNKIVRNEQGEWSARSMSDDWTFARKANDLGAKVFATREIRVVHVGEAKFPNQGTSGWAYDHINGRAEI